jgi:PAS domain S-box-containing protein
MANGNGSKLKRQPVDEVANTPLAKGGTAVLEAEREQIEKVWGEPEQYRTAILNSLSEHVVFQDLEHRVLWVNKVAAESVGLPAEELVGRYCYDVWGRGGRPCPGCPVEKAQKKGKPQAGEITTPDGKVWLIKGYPILNTNGDVRGLVEMTLEITERKKAEEELQTEKNKLNSVIDSLEYGLTIQDRDFNIIYQNEQGKKPFGEHIGEKCYRIYAGREKVCVGCPVKKAFKDGKSHTGVRKNLLPSGELAYWENTASPVRDAKGKIVYCLEITRNITKRKQVEEELQAEKNKLQSLISAMEFSLTIQDRDFNIIYQNEPSQKTSSGSRVGEKCYKVYEDRDTICDGCPAEKAFKDGKSHTAERQRTDPSGKIRYWENTASPIRDAKGNIASCLEIGVEITEHKKAEQALADEATRRRILIDQSSDGIVVLDKNGKVYEANKRFAEMLGYTYEEAQKLSVWDWEYLFPREQVAEMIATIGPEGDHFETKHRRKDGSTFDVEISTNGAVVSGQKLIFCVCRDITERKKSEEELRHSETRLAEAQRLAHIGSWEFDIVSNKLSWSDEVYQIFGLKPRQFGATYEAFLDRIHPDDREMVNKAYSESMKTKTPYSIIHRLLLKDGTVRYVNETGETFYDDEGKPIRSIGTVQDITERKQAEEALVEAEKKYKNLVEAASDLIWEVDTQGTYTFVSPNIKELLGYDVKEVVGKKRTLDFTPKKELKKWLKRFKVINAKRESFAGLEVLHHHKDGTPLIFEVSGVPFFDSDGNFKGYVGINKNVTERKQMTEALKESQKFSTGLMENSPNPKSVLNPDTSIRYVNPAFEKLTGYKMAEVVGMKAPYPWWPKAERETMLKALKNAMQSGGKKSEHVFYKKNGEPVWVMLNSGPVIHRKKLLYFLISWLDITDSKRAEEERAELEQKAHLASRLASVGEMASGIAHEINNPLTAVIGFAQLLMDNDLPEEIKEDLVIIHKEAQRAAGVARNLLTFARKHAPSKQPTDVNSIIEGVLTLRAYEQNVSNIQINTKLTPDLPNVLADYSQLQQVFINIILNAEAAMLEANNGGTLTITTQRFDHSIRASFADNGPGIDKENLNRIFDPFFTTKEVGKGTGLGLSVCHGIIAEHGGKIYARSKPGSGATFIVELPISSQEPTEELNEPAKEPEKANPGS